jgi:hypothetical protein
VSVTATDKIENGSIVLEIDIGPHSTTEEVRVMKEQLKLLIPYIRAAFARDMPTEGKPRLPGRFKSWCQREGSQSFPPSLETVLKYLRSQRQKLPRAWLRQDVDDIIQTHRVAGLKFPPSPDEVEDGLYREFVLEAFSEAPPVDYTFSSVSASIGGLWSSWSTEWLLPALNSETKESPDEVERSARKEYERVLRLLVNEYIDTGLRPDGSEAPLERNLNRAPNCKQAIERAADKLRLEIYSLADGPDVSIVIGKDACSADDKLIEARMEAECWFTVLVMSDLRARIAKCRYPPCGLYFLLSRKRKHPRERGTFCCARHNSSGSARTKTTKERQQEDRTLLEFASRRFSEWQAASPDWKRENPVKKWLADKVTCFIGTSVDPKITRRNNVTANWVMRNLPTILANALNVSPELKSSGSAPAGEPDSRIEDREPLTSGAQWMTSLRR